MAHISELLSEKPWIETSLPKRVFYTITMRKAAIGIGRVLRVLEDTEAQAPDAQHIVKIEKDEAMTKLLLDSSPSLQYASILHAYLVNGMQDDQDGYMKVWCFYYAFSGALASIWLLCATSIAVIVVMAVGFGARDTQLGLSVGTGVLTVLTSIQGAIVMWIMY